MAVFTITVALVLMTYISCGNTKTDEPTVTPVLIQHMHTWLKTNLTNIPVSVDMKHQSMAIKIASKLHREQAEVKGAVVRVVDGGGIWLLLFPNITIPKKATGNLNKAKEFINACLLARKDTLNKMLNQGFLGGATVGSCSKRVLKMCTVFVTANKFLHEYQQRFIQSTTSESVPQDWNKYLNTDRLKDLQYTHLLPMTTRAILEAINYSEQHNETGKGPILNKFIQDNRIKRTIIFEGKVNLDNTIQEPQDKRGSSALDLKLNWIFCGFKTEPSYAIVKCENGHFFIVGSCTEPWKRFQATFSASVEEQKIPNKAELRDQQLNDESGIQKTDTNETQMDLLTWSTTTDPQEKNEMSGIPQTDTNETQKDLITFSTTTDPQGKNEKSGIPQTDTNETQKDLITFSITTNDQEKNEKSGIPQTDTNETQKDLITFSTTTDPQEKNEISEIPLTDTNETQKDLITFSTTTDDQEKNGKSGTPQTDTNETDGDLITWSKTTDQEKNEKSGIPQTNTNETQGDLITWSTTTDHDHNAGDVDVKTNPNPNQNGTSSNQNPYPVGLPIDSPSLLSIPPDNLLPSKTPVTQVTPVTKATFSPMLPVDVSKKLGALVKMIPRPTQPDVMTNGKIHILERTKSYQYQIPASRGNLFTAILTVQIGMERENSKKYRLIRIQDALDSIELDVIRQEAMYHSKKIFGTPDEKVFWSVKDTPVNSNDFQLAVEDGLFMFTETIFAMGKRPGYNNKVSRYLAHLMLKKGPIYCGAAAQAFSKQGCSGDLVQLIIQFSL